VVRPVFHFHHGLLDDDHDALAVPLAGFFREGRHTADREDQS
jgi:hypothetical protein